MAIKFLAGINLEKNELQNARIQNLASAPSSPVEGQIYYNTTNNVLQYYDDAGWETISASSGTVTSVSGGTGLTGTVTSTGSINVDYSGTDNIVLAATEATGAAPTDGSSILISDDSDNVVKYVNIQDLPFSNNSGTVTSVGLTAGSLIDISGGPITSSGNITVNVDLSELTDMTAAMVAADEFVVLDGTAQRRKAASEIPLSIFNNDSGFITGNQSITFTGDVTGSGTTSVALTIASSAVEASMLNNNVISGKTALTSGLASTDELMVSDGGTIKRMDVSVLETYMQDNLTFTTNTDTDVSVSNLETRLGEIDSNVTIGNSSSVQVSTAGPLVVEGNLTVNGTTTTVNSTTIAIDDHHFKVATDNNGSTNDFGYYGRYGATAEYAGLTFDTSAEEWTLYHSNATEPGNTTFTPDTKATLNVDRMKAVSLNINGTAVTATAAEINKIDGFTGTHLDLNYAKDLRATGVTTSEFDKLDGLTSTTTELNTATDGSTSRGTTALADGDGFVHNDNGTMRQTNVTKIVDYVDSKQNWVGTLSGDGSATTYTMTHNLNSRDVIVQVVDYGNAGSGATYETVMVETKRNGVNTVQVIFATAPTTSEDYRVLVTKVV